MISRPRAPRLTPDERRRKIKEATLPLLAEHGLQVSTKQIAEAAKIAEGTIFKAFNTKDELINEVIADAFSTEELVETITAIPADLPLEQTILTITRELHRGIFANRALIAMIPHPNQPPSTGAKCPVHDHAKSKRALLEALTTTLAQHETELRTTPERAAMTLVGLSFAAGHPMTANPALSPEVIADLVLHGIGTTC